MTPINQLTHENSLNKHLTRFQRQLLEKNLQAETISEYRQRIQIMLLADEGKTQTQICRTLSCSPLTARHWIFMAKSGQAHNWKDQAIGRPKTVTADYLDRLKQLMSENPKNLGYPFSRWTGQWLSKHLSQEFNIEVTARHVNRLIEEMNDGVRVVDAPRTETLRGQQPQVGKSRQLIIADLGDAHKSVYPQPQSI
jgi:transposase